VRITVNPSSPVVFPLQFRIPGWAAGATVLVNGKPEPAPSPASFARIDRTWNPGDRVEIKFPMVPRVSRWFNNSVAIERGPIVFSYGIGEDWVKLRDRGMTADWQVFPTTPWNFALVLDTDSPATSIAVTESKPSPNPFTREGTPIRLSVKARKVNQWRAEDGAAGPPPQSPVATDQAEESISLIPYAAAKLRITAFPQCKS
jgi:hypothetical protein